MASKYYSYCLILIEIIQKYCKSIFIIECLRYIFAPDMKLNMKQQITSILEQFSLAVLPAMGDCQDRGLCCCDN